VAIWCSPLLRARQTATVVADAIGVAPTILDDLIESARGSSEGQSVAHLEGTEPALFAAFEAGDKGFAFPGGESLLDQVSGPAVIASVHSGQAWTNSATPGSKAPERAETSCFLPAGPER
jgi:Histidine phosphatase superfamily (branch 1)